MLSKDNYEEANAVYRFENNIESSTDKFNLGMTGGAIVYENGKIGKALKLQGKAGLGSFPSAFICSIDSRQSVVGWIKLGKQSRSFQMYARAYGDIFKETFGIRILPDGNIEGFLEKWLSDDQMVKSQQVNVSNNRWNHIGFSVGNRILSLYLNGEKIKSVKLNTSPHTLCDTDTGVRIGMWDIEEDKITGQIHSSILIDDIGFFEADLSVYEIRGLYNSKNGIQGFLEAMPINPADNVVTTWGDLKKHQR